MSFEWSLYLKVADKLKRIKNNTIKEACLRSAVSRLYYGVFGKTREILETQGYIFQRGKNIHWEVINTMKSKNPKVGSSLDRLRKERNQADYDGTIKFTKAKVEKAYQFAEDIKKWLLI